MLHDVLTSFLMGYVILTPYPSLRVTFLLLCPSLTVSICSLFFSLSCFTVGCIVLTFILYCLFRHSPLFIRGGFACISISLIRLFRHLFLSFFYLLFLYPFS